MKKLILFILFYSLNGYSQIIKIDYPNNTIIEFSTNKVILKTKGYSDIVYNIISKSIENNFDIYQLSNNTRMVHAKNFPTYNKGYIELDFFNDITKKNDTINFIYNKYK